MSLSECTASLLRDGKARINASEFRQHELEEAAAFARERHACLIIDNLLSRTCAQIGRIVDAGGRQVNCADIYLV